MKVLVAGATGAIGRELVPRLVERNHEVWGMTRTAEKRGQIEEMGAQAVVADALDADAVARAVAEAEPEAIIHEMTDLSVADFNPRKLSSVKANRLHASSLRGRAGRWLRGGPASIPPVSNGSSLPTGSSRP